MSEPETPSTTTICLWCNRVLHWGKRDINYEVCDGCAPRALEHLDMLHARRRLLQVQAPRRQLEAVR